MAERRKNLRAVVQLEVEGTRQHLQRVPLYVTANLSLGGMFLITTNPLNEKTRLSLRFSLPGDSRKIEVTGEVLWARDEVEIENLPPGMGIRFIQLDEENREHIRKFVEEAAQRK